MSDKKLTREWVFITHPLGHDPYESIHYGFLVNLEVTTLRRVKDTTEELFLDAQAKRNGLVAEPEPVIHPFDGNPLI